MKTIALMAVLMTAVLFTAAEAATLRFRLTVPTANNVDPMCGSSGTATTADSVMVRWTATGPGLAASDSVYSPRGAVLSRAYPVPGGTYAVVVDVLRRSTTSGLWNLNVCPSTRQFTVAPDDLTPPAPIVIEP